MKISNKQQALTVLSKAGIEVEEWFFNRTHNCYMACTAGTNSVSANGATPKKLVVNLMRLVEASKHTDEV